MTRVVCSLKYRMLYTCARCGVTCEGETARAEMDKSSVEELVQSLKNLRAQSAQMPVGWGNYSDGYRCPECVVGSEVRNG